MNRPKCDLPRIKRIVLVFATCAVSYSSHGVRADEPTHLSIVGGLGGVSQYLKYEKPYWSNEIEKLSAGRITADIHSFDSSGLPGQEMLKLMQLGVVPFGTALLALVSGDEPELNAVDLPALNPDIGSLRTTVQLYRPYLQTLLRDKFGIELLGIYVYPAQVLFCTKSFAGLNDLSGRRIRTSSVGQSELMSALGAIPAQIPFADTVAAIRNSGVDCAITGTLSGNEIGLSDETSFVHSMAISWGLSFFGANASAWNALSVDNRDIVQVGVHVLEQRIWTAAEQETKNGLACDTGQSDCVGGHRSHMTLVVATKADTEFRRHLLVDTVLPNWIRRCGEDCITAWNETLGPKLGISADSNGQVGGNLR